MLLFVSDKHVFGGQPIDILVEHFVADGREHFVDLFYEVLSWLEVKLIADRVFPSSDFASFAVNAGFI